MIKIANELSVKCTCINSHHLNNIQKRIKLCFAKNNPLHNPCMHIKLHGNGGVLTAYPLLKGFIQKCFSKDNDSQVLVHSMLLNSLL